MALLFVISLAMAHTHHQFLHGRALQDPDPAMGTKSIKDLQDDYVYDDDYVSSNDSPLEAIPPLERDLAVKQEKLRAQEAAAEKELGEVQHAEAQERELEIALKKKQEEYEMAKRMHGIASDMTVEEAQEEARARKEAYHKTVAETNTAGNAVHSYGKDLERVGEEYETAHEEEKAAERSYAEAKEEAKVATKEGEPALKIEAQYMEKETELSGVAKLREDLVDKRSGLEDSVKGMAEQLKAKDEADFQVQEREAAVQDIKESLEAAWEKKVQLGIKHQETINTREAGPAKEAVARKELADAEEKLEKAQALYDEGEYQEAQAKVEAAEAELGKINEQAVVASTKTAAQRTDYEIAKETERFASSLTAEAEAALRAAQAELEETTTTEPPSWNILSDWLP